MELIRRILVVLTVFALAIAAFAWLRGGVSDRYGLIELLQGRQRPDKSTAEPVVKERIPGGESSSPSPLGTEEVPLLTRLDREYSLLADRTIPAVVSINTIRSERIPRLYIGPSGVETRDQQLHKPGLGSGVIVSREGHVLTNYHVIKDVEGIEMTIHTGEAHRASIVGSDPLLDIAVLKIDSERTDFPALPFGDSDEVEVGQSILAVGNPLGLSGTVTRGIVSAKERSLTDGTPELIQTDAVINPGSSGGPLINTRGEVIGITVAIYKGGTGSSGWQGVALAVPSNPARETYHAILQRGRPVFGYLGITVGREVVSGGIAITGIVGNSPAETAALELGDLILEFDGQRQKSAKGFLGNVLRTAPGKQVDLLILRANRELALQAVIGERPNQTANIAEAPTEKAVASIRKTLGIESRNLTRAELLRAGTFPTSPGVLVVAVDPKSPFHSILGEGDMVMQVNHLPVGDVNALWGALSGLPPGREAVVYVVADGKGQALKFVLGDTGRSAP